MEKRGYSRRSLNSRARVAVFSQALNLLEIGYARLRNISLSGAWISDLALPSQSLPTKAFEVALIVEEGAIHGVSHLGLVQPEGFQRYAVNRAQATTNFLPAFFRLTITR